MSDSVTPWTAAHQASLSFTISRSLLKLMSIKPVMPSNHLILCHPLLLQTSIFPRIRVFSKESALRIRWPKYWSFSFCISSSNEYSGLISFRIDWFDSLLSSQSVWSLSHVWLFATPWPAAHQASLSFTVSQSLLKLMSIESVIYPTISSSVVAFSSCLQSFPASRSLPMSQFFASGGQSIGVTASELVIPMNIEEKFPLG